MNGKYFLTALSLILSVGGGLTACSSNPNTRGWFAPDPQLQADSTALEPAPTPSSQPTPTKVPQPTPTKVKENRLPPNFPQAIPIYDRAKLLESQYWIAEIKGETRWQTEVDRDAIAEFYRRELEEKNWAIETSESDLLIARQDNLNIKLSITSPSEFDPKTIFLIEYAIDLPEANLLARESKPEESQDALKADNSLPKPEESQDELKADNSLDLTPVSSQVRGYIEDLAALGVLSANFDPNKTVTRREYARWLFETHNQLYRDRPTQQIRPVNSASQPAFGDIKASDRDFAIIQGLAEAGIIPSRLTQDTEALLFQPDAPLTRETLIFWKVPLDLRKALP
ncbi:MAG: S-layer homology domain-containing protein, partial [Spirulina sp.]